MEMLEPSSNSVFHIGRTCRTESAAHRAGGVAELVDTGTFDDSNGPWGEDALFFLRGARGRCGQPLRLHAHPGIKLCLAQPRTACPARIDAQMRRPGIRVSVGDVKAVHEPPLEMQAALLV